MYTAVDKILIEPLPYPHPDDLYTVLRKAGRQVTGPEVAELDKAGGVIEGAVAVRTNPLTLAASANADAIRLSAVLIAGLGLGALLLVSMGLFGVISGSVARRRGELAVRLALGATHGRVIRLVVGEGARLVALGLLIGVPGIYMSGQALQGLLIGVSPFDTPTLVAVAFGLAAVALLACYLAARRVTAIEPQRLLREGG